MMEGEGVTREEIGVWERAAGAGSVLPTPHLTSPLKEADLRTTPNFAGWRQPDQIGTIGLHRWIRGLCEGLLKGGRDELGKGVGGFLPARE